MALLVDPPELAQYAGRGDPHIDVWPGKPVTRQGIMAASGDPRDWFRYRHRERAAIQAWAEFADARRRRRKFSAGFEWNQILILGDYGSGKTTLGIHMARKWFGLGHPTFSNSSTLFGWHLENEEMYTAMGFMPANSCLLIDESSAALSSRVAHGVAIASFNEMNLNTRKKNCVVAYMSAQDWEIAPSIRRNCKEVWMPIKASELVYEGKGKGEGLLRPADNPDNFILAWHVWDDFPYRKGNIIEGPAPDGKNGGFGPPAYTLVDVGTNVRRAMMLNDTFELAAAGAATLADRDTVKDSLRSFRDGRGPGDSGETPWKGSKDDDPQMRAFLHFIQDREFTAPEHFTPGEIAAAIGVDPRGVGILVQKAFPGVKMVRGKGYSAEAIYGIDDINW